MLMVEYGVQPSIDTVWFGQRYVAYHIHHALEAGEPVIDEEVLRWIAGAESELILAYSHVVSS